MGEFWDKHQNGNFYKDLQNGETMGSAMGETMGGFEFWRKT